MLSEGKLEELEKVAEAATAAPWVAPDGVVIYLRPDGFSTKTWLATMSQSDANWRANATHIVTFDPPTVLALISELRALGAERDEHAQRAATWKHERDRAARAEAELTALRAQAPAPVGGEVVEAEQP